MADVESSLWKKGMGMKASTADPIARAIGTFAALKGMEMKQEEAEQERETARFKMDLLGRQDARAQERLALEKDNYKRETALQDKEQKRKDLEWEDKALTGAREKADQILAEFTSQMEAAGIKDWGPAEVENLLGRLEPVKKGLRNKLGDLYDPQKVEERHAATKNILGQLRSGDFDHDSLLENANIAFAPELDARGRKYGAKQVRFSRLVPSPQGDGFMAEAEITRADGSTYRAPLTVNGGTAEEGDNEVKNFKMEQVAPYLVGQLLTLEGAKAYLKARGKIKPSETEYKTVTDADGKVWAVNPKNPEDKLLVTDAVKPDNGSNGPGSVSPAVSEMADTLAQQVIDGRLDPAMISKRGGLQQAVFSRVEEIHPGFNIVGANANARYLTNTGNLQSRALMEGVVPLYDKLLEVGESLGNSSIPGVNRVVNWAKEQTGNPDIVAFNNLRDDVIAESERVLLGSGVLSDSKYLRAVKNVNSAQSFPQLQAAIEQLKTAVGARRHALDTQPIDPTGQREAPAVNLPGANGKTVTRTGRTPDGRKVIQYSNGSWEYGK